FTHCLPGLRLIIRTALDPATACQERNLQRRLAFGNYMLAPRRPSVLAVTLPGTSILSASGSRQSKSPLRRLIRTTSPRGIERSDSVPRAKAFIPRGESLALDSDFGFLAGFSLQVSVLKQKDLRRCLERLGPMTRSLACGIGILLSSGTPPRVFHQTAKKALAC